MKTQGRFKGKHILILEGYARQCLPFMRSFKKHGCTVTVLCNSKMDLAYVSRYADNKIIGICDPERYEESEKYICNLIKTGEFDLVLPLVDFSARILAENKEELSKYAIIASNEKQVFEKAQDKLSVMKVCMENGIPCPKTFFDLAEEKLNDVELSYPVVVKPRRGCGAKGFHCFSSQNELIEFLSNNAFEENVVQEFIPSSKSVLAVNLFIDNNGVVKTSFTYACHRWFPLKGGTGTLNELVDRPDAVKICIDLVKILNLRGYIGVDLMDDPRDGIPKVIEVNPRILACAKIAFDGGVDFAEFILQDSFEAKVEERLDYDFGRRVRMSQTDILWFLKSPDRWRTNPSWFSIRKTKDQTFYWDDPLPWFAFGIKGFVNLKKEMKTRE